MQMQKAITAILIDFYDLMSENDFSKHPYALMTVSKARSMETVDTLLKVMVADIILIDITTFIKHKKQISILEKSFEGLAVIIGNSPEFFPERKIHEFLFLDEMDYVIRPFSMDEVQNRISSNTGYKCPMNSLNKYHFTNALIEKLSTHGAHEFNTPMNGILGVLNLLNEDTESLDLEDRKELIHAAISSCIRLKRTYMNLLLSIKGFQTGAWQSHTNQSTIENCIDSALQNLRKERGFFFSKSNVESARVIIPEEHLLILLYESIDNAIKFGDAGIGVALQGVVNTPESSYTLSIRDFGNCTDYSFTESFGAFLQPNRAKLEQQGWGLGLYLICQISFLYKIKWTIEASNPGTTITFTFPLSY